MGIPMDKFYAEHLEKGGIGIGDVTFPDVVGSLPGTEHYTADVPEPCDQFHFGDIVDNGLGHGSGYFGQQLFLAPEFKVGIDPMDALGIGEHAVVAELVVDVQAEQKSPGHSDGQSKTV